MKKFTLFAASLFVGLCAQAQIFSDDFESYATGSYLCPQSPYWRTWSGSGDNTPEDVMISDQNANSGTKSIFFQGSSAGGPSDVLFDFQQLYNSGVFTLNMSFYVEQDKGAYFNFQGANAVGSSYALEVFMSNGSIQLKEGATTNTEGVYPEAAWFDLTIVCNMSTKVWEAKIDGVSIGKWTQTVNSVRYVDLFPTGSDDIFYVDDVSFDHAAYTPATLNASAADLNMNALIAGQTGTPTLTIVNAGSTTITSLNVSLTYNGATLNQSVTGLNLAAGATTDVNMSPVALVAGVNLAKAYITGVNGAADNMASDDTSQRFVNPVLPAPGKVVVGEEGTGTWCQYCPRGAVFMDQYAANFGAYWAGVAVHNGDPMTIAEYDAGMNFSGYPSAKVDRGTAVDPSAMTNNFYTRIQTAPKAVVAVGANYTASIGKLDLSGTFTFNSAANNNYKVVFVLTEDGVTGTGSGYAQSNAYAGGGLGPMGGYENLPNPVPASQMVYDHVARAMGPIFGGYANSFPATVAAGSTHTVNYTFMLPSTWNTNSMHVIIMLVAPNGTIDNAGYVSFAEAVSNPYISGTAAGVTEITELEAAFKIFPNPATTQVNFSFDLSSTSEVSLKVMDMSGKVLTARDYSAMNGQQVVAYDTKAFASGVYLVEVSINGKVQTKRLIIE